MGAPVTPVQHLLLTDDTSETAAAAFAGLLNAGTNFVWASAQGNQLTVVARAMGSLGNGIVVELDALSQGLVVSAPSNTLTGGIDGDPYDLAPDGGGLNDTLMAAAQFWRTDLTANPRLNRAARDWHAAYFRALKHYRTGCSGRLQYGAHECRSLTRNENGATISGRYRGGPQYARHPD